MKYSLAKLHHVTQYELSISPKGRKEGGGSSDLNHPEVLLSDQHRSSVYMKEQKSQVVHQKINLYMGKWASINTLSDYKSEMDTIIFRYNWVNLVLCLQNN